MKKTLIWPNDPKEAIRYLRQFVVNTVEPLDISFPEGLPDPVKTARAWLNGEISDDDFVNERIRWWHYLDTVGGVREFRRPEALVARLAICLVGFTPREHLELTQCLDWFFESLEMMHVDISPIVAKADEYFSPK